MASCRCIMYLTMISVFFLFTVPPKSVDAQSALFCIHPPPGFQWEQLECNIRTSSNLSQVKNVGNGTICSLNDSSAEVNNIYFVCADGDWYQNSTRGYKEKKKAKYMIDHPLERVKRGWFEKVVNTIVCFFTLCFLRGRNGPPPDRTSPNLQCPHSISITNRPMQTYGVATWVEPRAYDDKDGEVSVTRHGKVPGSSFSSTTTTISYTARDKSGNMARCDMTITLTVIKCPNPSEMTNGYYHCHPSNPFVLESVCSFGCYDGYELHGPSRITCTKDSIWSNPQPTCKPFTCNTLLPVARANVSCTDNDNFRSICTYHCEKGYDMPPSVSRTLICSLSKTWRGNGVPVCQDIEPPTFSTCPSIIIQGSDQGFNSTRVSWELPTVEDNSGPHISPILSNGLERGSRFEIGTHEIKYSAKDSDGNTARPCLFSVIVRDVRCHRIYPTPYMRVDCPHGSQLGAACNISCDPGKVLEGQGLVICNKDPRGLFGSWKWGTKQPSCINGNKCVPLKAPKNGAVACDIWMGGDFCQFQCMKGTDMPGIDWRKLHVCSTRGEWVPLISTRACEATRSGRPVAGAESYFYVGHCPDTETQNRIRENFYNVIRSDILFSPEACKDLNQCHVGNIQVRCGEIDLVRSKRDTLIDQYNISETLTIQYDLQLDLTSEEGYLKVSNLFKNTFQRIDDHFKNTNISEKLADIDVVYHGTQAKHLRISCPSGSVESADSFSCIECSEGTYYNTTTMTCTSCQKGYYQNMSGQHACKACPPLTTTRITGAISADYCETACTPGHWSNDGAEPCSLCEAGTYQPMYGQIKCIRCLGSKTTLMVGEISDDNCQEFDVYFPRIPEKNVSLQVEPFDTSNFTMMFWLQVSTNETCTPLRLLSNDDEFLAIRVSSNYLIVSLNGHNFSHNQTSMDHRWHHYTFMIEDASCKITVLVDRNQIFTEEGGCNQSETITEIVLGDEHTIGSISQLNIWKSVDVQILPSPTKCFNELTGDLVDWFDFEDAVLIGAVTQMPSQCDDYDECTSNPCVNGICQDGLQTYSCTCMQGFTGQKCEVNIDDCGENVCMNGASCKDGVLGYKCICPKGFTGSFCEIKTVDGQWGTWSNWSECSTSCGAGLKVRTRMCNDPSPDNGGKECEGPAKETYYCNETECRVCEELRSPDNGTLLCQNNSGTLNCTVHCDEGFEFDIEPLNYYTCGPETFNEWNFQTEDNPYRRLPSCQVISPADKINITYRALYRDLYCNTDESFVQHRVRTQIEPVINSLSCVSAGSCAKDNVEIINCRSGRSSRSANHNTVGFVITLSTSPSVDSNTNLYALDKAFREILEAADGGSFTLNVYDEDFYIDDSLIEITSGVMCPDGLINVNHYCVPCGKGAYLLDDQCQRCDYGEYQDEPGQSRCNKCPSGYTTEGRGSIGKEDCKVQLNLDLVKELISLSAALIACTVIIFVIAMTVVFLLVYKRQRAKLVIVPLPMDISMCDKVAKRKFYTKSINFHNDNDNWLKDVNNDKY